MSHELCRFQPFALCAMPSVIASCHGDRPAATVDYIIAVTALAKRLG